MISKLKKNLKTKLKTVTKVKKGLTKTHKKRSVISDSKLSFFHRFLTFYIGSLYAKSKKWLVKVMVASGSFKFFSFSFKLLPYKGRKERWSIMTKKFFRSFGGNSSSAHFARSGLSFTIAIAIVLGLVACGGGGGGGSTTPPVIITPTGTLSVAPATCTVQALLGKCTATATFATANATTAKLMNAGGSALSTSLSGTQVVDVLIGTNTYTLSANGGAAVATASATGVCTSGTASNGTICVSPVTATLTASSPIVNGAKSTLAWGHTGDTPTGCTTSANWSNGGSLSGTGLSDALTANATFTYSCTNANGTTTATAVVTVCAASDTIVSGVCTPPVVATWWPPATISPIGTKVVGSTSQISSASRIIGDASWQTDVKNGVVKFVDTGMILTGYSTRPLVWAYYISLDGTSCNLPVFKDDGLPISLGTQYTYGACSTDSLTWVVGTLSGIIRYTPQKNKCFEMVWKFNNATSSFDVTDTETACPF